MTNLSSRLDWLEETLAPERDYHPDWPKGCPPCGHGDRMDKLFSPLSPKPEFRLSQSTVARLSSWPANWRGNAHNWGADLPIPFDGEHGTALRILIVAEFCILWGSEELAEEAAAAIRGIAAGNVQGAHGFASKGLRFLNEPWVVEMNETRSSARRRAYRQ